jgi:hypothetical protein
MKCKSLHLNDIDLNMCYDWVSEGNNNLYVVFVLIAAFARIPSRTSAPTPLSPAKPADPPQAQ